MIYVDWQFARQALPFLEQSKELRQYVATFRCPYCGDSKKNAYKTRGFFHPDKKTGTKLKFTCHNCGENGPIAVFLKDHFPTIHRQYVIEKFKSGAHTFGQNRNTFRGEDKDIEYERKQIKFRTIAVPPHSVCVTELPGGHPCRDYVESRCIPQKLLKYLYYTENFNKTAVAVNEEYWRSPDDERLVIPFYNADMEFSVLQGRALGDSYQRYVTLKTDESADKLYGLYKLNNKYPRLIVEGPIDSLFLPNGIGSADSNLTVAVEDKSKDILIPDNQPRNRELTGQIRNWIDAGYKVVIWPKDNEYKDINDMVLNGVNVREDIANNIYSGVRAKIQFTQWAKV